MKDLLWKNILAVREKSPLVHNITNYVVMNSTANALLAVGASPIMAHAHNEMNHMVSIVNALVVNIGTLDEYWVESMRLAVKQANAMEKPWVLDPVGAGATPYRNKVLEELLTYHPTVIRGNASEIMALARMGQGSKGVDSIHRTDEALDAALELNKEFGSVVCISGATDRVLGTERSTALSNGNPIMARITGMGCIASALIGAFCAINPGNPFEATTAAMALMGVTGEMAAEKSDGPGSMMMHFMDTLYHLPAHDFEQRVKIDYFYDNL